MKTSKRSWTRAEKSLFLAPVLFALGMGGLWRWHKAIAFSIEVPATKFHALEFSPDGKRLLVFFEDSKTGLAAGQVYDVETRIKVSELAALRRLGAGRPYIYWPSWSPDGTRIVAGYEDDSRGTAKIADRYGPGKKNPSFHFNHIGKMVSFPYGCQPVSWLYG